MSHFGIDPKGAAEYFKPQQKPVEPPKTNR